jgi:hypothetical protein
MAAVPEDGVTGRAQVKPIEAGVHTRMDLFPDPLPIENLLQHTIAANASGEQVSLRIHSEKLNDLSQLFDRGGRGDDQHGSGLYILVRDVSISGTKHPLFLIGLPNQFVRPPPRIPDRVIPQNPEIRP